MLETASYHDLQQLCRTLLAANKQAYRMAQRAENERQQMGPVLRDYLRQAGDAARQAIEAANKL